MNVIAIIPSLNPDERLIGVVEGLIGVGFTDVLVINDGSRPDSCSIFKAISDHPEVTILNHETNKGKGCALKTGFNWVLENRPDSIGVITVDGDGIHRAGDALRLADALIKEPDKLWLGVRDYSLSLLPEDLRKGNAITRKVIRLANGITISDTQANLRGISTQLIPLLLRVKGDRYEYETQMLLDFHRQNIEFKELPIDTVLIEETKPSHYRPYQDTARILKMLFIYLLSSLTATAVDWLLFTLLNVSLASVFGDALRIFLSTAIARVISSVVNYEFNRKLVFNDQGSVRRTAIRYVVACSCQATASYALVLLFNTLLDPGIFMQSVVKMCVDVFLAFINYYVQVRWVFAGSEKIKARS